MFLCVIRGVIQLCAKYPLLSAGTALLYPFLAGTQSDLQTFSLSMLLLERAHSSQFEF